MADPSSTTTATDHLLIELCRRADFLGKEIDHINAAEPDEDRAEEQTGPLYKELATIQTAIINMPARTLSGAVAKAWHVRWCRAGDLTTEMDDPGMDFEPLHEHRARLAGDRGEAVKHPRRTKTAYHEAGHAVIGRVLTLACGSATIKPDYKDRSAGVAAAVPPQD